jgi:hypothetical protein
MGTMTATDANSNFSELLQNKEQTMNKVLAKPERITKAIPRTLPNKFLYDLANPDGLLKPIFDAVQKDSDLSLQIRDGYINIYYLGGNLLHVAYHSPSKCYMGEIAKGYGYNGDAKESMDSVDASRMVAKTFSDRKKAMLKWCKKTNEKKTPTETLPDKPQRCPCDS